MTTNSTHYNNWPIEVKQYFIDHSQISKKQIELNWTQKIWKFLKDFVGNGENLGFHYTYGFVYEGVYPRQYCQDHYESCDYQIHLEINTDSRPDVLLFFKNSLVHQQDFHYHYDLMGTQGQKIHDIKAISITENYPIAHVIFDVLSIDLKNAKTIGEVSWK